MRYAAVKDGLVVDVTVCADPTWFDRFIADGRYDAVVELADDEHAEVGWHHTGDPIVAFVPDEATRADEVFPSATKRAQVETLRVAARAGRRSEAEKP